MSSLPVEAWHVVLDYVVAPLPAQFQNPYHPLEFEGGDEYKASIRLLEALSLVCRSMHSLASRHLWKEGFIRLKLSAEAKKLIENPIVCARLTHIVLHHERPDEKDDPLLTSVILELLTKCPSLESIHLRSTIGDEWSAHHWDTIQSNKTLCKVTRYTYLHTFSLERMDFGVEPMELMPSLEKVDLIFCGRPITNYVKDRVHIEPVHLPKLKELGFYGFEISSASDLPWIFKKATIAAIEKITTDDPSGILGRGGQGKKLLKNLQEVAVRIHHNYKMHPEPVNLSDFGGLPRLATLRLYTGMNFCEPIDMVLSKVPKPLETVRAHVTLESIENADVPKLVKLAENKALVTLELVTFNFIGKEKDILYRIRSSLLMQFVAHLYAQAGIFCTLRVSPFQLKEYESLDPLLKLMFPDLRYEDRVAMICWGATHIFSPLGHFVEENTLITPDKAVPSRGDNFWPVAAKEGGKLMSSSEWISRIKKQLSGQETT